MTLRRTVSLYTLVLIFLVVLIWYIIIAGMDRVKHENHLIRVSFTVVERLFEEETLVFSLLQNPDEATYGIWQEKHSDITEMLFNNSQEHPELFERGFINTFATHHQAIQTLVDAYVNKTMYGDTGDNETVFDYSTAIRSEFNQLLIQAVATFNEANASTHKTVEHRQYEMIFLMAAFILLILLFNIRLNNAFLKKIDSFVKKLQIIKESNYTKRFTANDDTELGRIKMAVNSLLEKVYTSSERLETALKKSEHDGAELSKLLTDSEKTKKATLNILEDFAEEKEKLHAQVIETMKYKMAVDATSDHIIITDPEGIIIYANNSVERITGYKPEEVMGKKAGAKQLWGGHMDHDFYVTLWQTIKEEKKVFVGEVKNRRKSGEFYYALASISPVLNKEGELLYFIGIERDISEEKAIDQAKTEFVSLASHQLRTPLSTINWYSEMMLSGDAGDLNTNQKTYVEEIYNGSQRMVQLVNALLNVSRIELGTFIVEAEATDMRKLVDNIINESEKDIILKHLTINKDYAADVPEVKLDVNLTRIMVQNLITNAGRYTPEKVTITVSVSTTDADLVFKVTDTGMGIPKQQQSQIFTKLFRADNVKETDTQGTGLGLYITKSILDHINGSISFVSEQDKGATFTITIPLSGMKNKEGTRRLQ